MQSGSVHMEKNASIPSKHISKIFSLGYTRVKFQEDNSGTKATKWKEKLSTKT